MALKPPIFLVRPGRHVPETGELFLSALAKTEDAVTRLRQNGLGEAALILAASSPGPDATARLIRDGLGATMIESAVAREGIDTAGRHPGAVNDLDAFLETTLRQADVDFDKHHGLVVVAHRHLTMAAQGKSPGEHISPLGLVYPYTPGSWPNPATTAA